VSKSIRAGLLTFAVVAIVCSAKGFVDFGESGARSSNPPGSVRGFAEPAWLKQSSHGCLACHTRQKGAAVELFSQSTHAKAGLKCDNCHGGRAGASSKEAAHANNFVGKPSPNDTLAMCGSCHTIQLATFKTSAHFPERRGAPRMDCSQCHGAHTVGSTSRNFSFALFCTGCHGLEYLPQLPQEFQKMLSLVDDEKDLIAALESTGGKASDTVLKRRREIRRMVAEIVHSTNTQGGIEKIPQILKLGDEFKTIIEREKR
jgi:Cytochrome c3